MQAIFALFGFVLILGSCSAMIVTPVSTPIWFILGLLFLTRPHLAPNWRGCTGFHAIAFLFLTILASIGAFVNANASSMPKPIFLEEPWFLIISLGLTVISTLIWLATSPDDDARVIKGWVVMQLVASAVAFMSVVAALYSIPWPKR